MASVSMFVEPPSRRSSTTITDAGLEIVLPARRHTFALIFQALWLVGWTTGGSMFVASMARGGLGAFALFATVWLVGWFAAAAAVFYGLMWALKGREIVTRRRDSLTIKRDLFGFGRMREFDRRAVLNMRVIPNMATFDNRMVPSVPWIATGRVAFDYGASTVRFADGVDEAEATLIVRDLAASSLGPSPCGSPAISSIDASIAPKGSRVVRVVRRLTIKLAILGVVLAAFIWAGPLISGALFLAWPPRADLVEHHHQITPVHGGHVATSVGVYVREDDDLVLTKGVAFALHRTYMSGDRQNRPFGIGTSSNADWFIVGDVDQFQWAAVILADGSQIRFTRTSSGTSYLNARFEHRESPTFFYGSQLAWNGLGWTLRMADGTIHSFSDCGPQTRAVCSLIKTRDPDGHVLTFERGADGTVRAIQGDGERVTFDHDDRGRVVAINDGWRDIVRYVYDTGGRLEKATMADGVVRRYAYGPRDELVRIEEPGRVIENTFDTNARLVTQVLHRPDSPDYVMEFAYTAVGTSVRETLITDNVGQRTLKRWDEKGYQMFESRESPPWQPAMMTFNRSEGGFLRSLTVRCTGPDGHVDQTYQVPATYYDTEDYKDYLFERLCGAPPP